MDDETGDVFEITEHADDGAVLARHYTATFTAGQGASRRSKKLRATRRSGTRGQAGDASTPDPTDEKIALLAEHREAGARRESGAA